MATIHFVMVNDFTDVPILDDAAHKDPRATLKAMITATDRSSPL